MRECLDEGILQSYFDGELSGRHMESVASHLTSCINCAAAARELEGELNLLSTALAPEFDATVPTERLRHRIDAAVAGLSLVKNTRQESAFAQGRGWFQSLASLFALKPQRAFGYAGLVVVLAFAVLFAIIQRRQTSTQTPGHQVATAEKPGSKIETGTGSENRVAIATPAPTVTAPVNTVNQTQRRNRQGKAGVTANPTIAQVKLLPGERSYLKTIAALDSTIKANSNRPMRPALQAEYERNLAVVDRALAATRSAAKKNPNDPDAAEFMFTAYQSKLDLLNTVADARLYNKQQ